VEPTRDRKGIYHERTLSVSAFITLLSGVCILIGAWRFPQFMHNWSEASRAGYLAFGFGLALWGLIQSGFSPWRLIGRFRGQASEATPRSTAREEKRQRGWTVSWIGALLVLVGIELVFSVSQNVRNPIASWAILVLGVLAGAAGLREIYLAMIPYVWRTRPRQKASLSRAGFVYLSMMTVFCVGSLQGRSNLLMLVFALSAGPFILNGWTTYSMLKRISLRRNFPERAMAGEPFSVELLLENRRHTLSSWLMEVIDRVSSPHETLETGVLFARVPPRQERAARYELRLMRRGTHEFGPAFVSTRFPLGLSQRNLEFQIGGQVKIYPRLGRLTSAWRRELSFASELTQRRDSRRGIFDDEFHGIREYRLGDYPRSIHWRTSARMNQIMVREYHQSRDRDLLLMVDLWTPELPAEADLDRVERALSFVATACLDQIRCSRETRVTLLVAGSTLIQWEGIGGAASIDGLLDQLATAEASTNPDVNKMLSEGNLLRQSSTRAIFVGTRPFTRPLSATSWESSEAGGVARAAAGAQGAMGQDRHIARDPSSLGEQDATSVASARKAEDQITLLTAITDFEHVLADGAELARWFVL